MGITVPIPSSASKRHASLSGLGFGFRGTTKIEPDWSGGTSGPFMGEFPSGSCSYSSWMCWPGSSADEGKARKTISSARPRTVRLGDPESELPRIVCSTLTVTRTDTPDATSSSCQTAVGYERTIGTAETQRPITIAMKCPIGMRSLSTRCTGVHLRHSGLMMS